MLLFRHSSRENNNRKNNPHSLRFRILSRGRQVESPLRKYKMLSINKVISRHAVTCKPQRSCWRTCHTGCCRHCWWPSNTVPWKHHRASSHAFNRKNKPQDFSKNLRFLRRVTEEFSPDPCRAETAVEETFARMALSGVIGQVLLLAWRTER